MVIKVLRFCLTPNGSKLFLTALDVGVISHPVQCIGSPSVLEIAGTLPAQIPTFAPTGPSTNGVPPHYCTRDAPFVAMSPPLTGSTGTAAVSPSPKPKAPAPSTNPPAPTTNPPSVAAPLPNSTSSSTTAPTTSTESKVSADESLSSNESSFTVKVKQIDPEVSHEVTIKSRMTIDELKVEVGAKFNVRPENQRLIVQGRVLKSGMCVDEYSKVLKGGAVIHLVTKAPSVPSPAPPSAATPTHSLPPTPPMHGVAGTHGIPGIAPLMGPGLGGHASPHGTAFFSVNGSPFQPATGAFSGGLGPGNNFSSFASDLAALPIMMQNALAGLPGVLPPLSHQSSTGPVAGPMNSSTAPAPSSTGPSTTATGPSTTASNPPTGVAANGGLHGVPMSLSDLLRLHHGPAPPPLQASSNVARTTETNSSTGNPSATATNTIPSSVPAPASRNAPESTVPTAAPSSLANTLQLISRSQNNLELGSQHVQNAPVRPGRMPSELQSIGLHLRSIPHSLSAMNPTISYISDTLVYCSPGTIAHDPDLGSSMHSLSGSLRHYAEALTAAAELLESITHTRPPPSHIVSPPTNNGGNLERRT